mmetsp:Transcript_24534/g.62284  ORF Transcript_24534/g.62284 Transcript_24534/m.62284 type:complete len:277 (-) Transcript_24534:401-1231(-)
MKGIMAVMARGPTTVYSCGPPARQTSDATTPFSESHDDEVRCGCQPPALPQRGRAPLGGWASSALAMAGHPPWVPRPRSPSVRLTRDTKQSPHPRRAGMRHSCSARQCPRGQTCCVQTSSQRTPFEVARERAKGVPGEPHGSRGGPPSTLQVCAITDASKVSRAFDRRSKPSRSSGSVMTSGGQQCSSGGRKRPMRPFSSMALRKSPSQAGGGWPSRLMALPSRCCRSMQPNRPMARPCFTEMCLPEMRLISSIITLCSFLALCGSLLSTVYFTHS